jgi:Mn2+/Fe2+ NRAMP family transporter
MTHARGIRVYSRSVLETVLGLIGMAVFIVATIALAAGVTWLVVKITPSGNKSKPETPPAA